MEERTWRWKEKKRRRDGKIGNDRREGRRNTKPAPAGEKE
jgi:hypothetical protein